MTLTIELICSCGTTTVKARILLQENIGAVLRCHACGEPYESQEILNRERFGIADFQSEEVVK